MNVGVLLGMIVGGVLLTVPLSHAQETIVGYGVGMSTCGTYIENRRLPNKYYDLEVASWFYGFVSGHNLYRGTPQAKGSIDENSVLVYLDKYCREHPLASVAVGADELAKVYSVRQHP